MLSRLEDELGGDDVDDEDNLAVMEKFMKDMGMMMEGMLDLQRR